MEASKRLGAKARGILFKGELVRAIIAGRKRVTRRLISPQPDEDGLARVILPEPEPFWRDSSERIYRCPQGLPGDRLYVKETWRPRVAHSHGADACDCADVCITYAADGAERFVDESKVPIGWTIPKAAKRGNVSPLFMPAWASRVWLDVVDVRAERLQDITEEDARAEGVDNRSDLAWDGAVAIAAVTREDPYAVAVRLGYRCGFAHKWDEINGERATWASNPWVWRIEFKETKAP